MCMIYGEYKNVWKNIANYLLLLSILLFVLPNEIKKLNILT